MPRGHVLPDGRTVAALRGEAGITQEELAGRSGYGLRTISKIESSRRTTAPTLTAVATVLAECLRRPIELVDLLGPASSPQGPTAAPSDGLIVGDHIKLLELSAGACTDPGCVESASVAVLTDTICVRHLPQAQTEIDFYYAALDGRAVGGSLSHPYDAEWLPRNQEGTVTTEPGQHSNCHVLRVNVAPRQNAQPFVQNRVEYVNGYDHDQQKWLRAHVAYPTESLTMLIRFPQEQPYRSLRGLRRGPGAEQAPLADKPISLLAGRMAYWRIAAPRPGDTYQLGWI